MQVTLLDTKTGETRIVDGFYAPWWSEGNGSCDCNRERYFGSYTDVAFCMGCSRYLIISATYKGYSLRELNENYPPELLDKYLPLEAL